MLIALWLALVLLVVGVTTCSLLPGKSWLLRICDFPRVQALFLGLFAMVPAVYFLLREPTASLFVATTVLLFAVCIQAWWCFSLTPLCEREVPDSLASSNASNGQRKPPPPDTAPPINDHSVRIVTANVDYTNRDPEAAYRALVGHRPHLLALVETDDAWRSIVDQRSDSFPWRVTEFRERGFGMCLLSRLPIESSEVRYLVNEDRPSIWAQVRLTSGSLVTVVVLHPPPPGLPRKKRSGRLSSKIRDVELTVVASIIGQRRDERWIVTGDFNDVGWSKNTESFKLRSGLRDPRIGRGMYTTYPSRWPVVRYPIDHVMVSRDFTVDRLSKLGDIGSDHLPLLADLRDSAAPVLEQHPTLTFHACCGKTTEQEKVVEVNH